MSLKAQLAMSGDFLAIPTTEGQEAGTISTERGGARDVAKHLIICRTALVTRSDLSPNASSAQAQKP